VTEHPLTKPPHFAPTGRSAWIAENAAGSVGLAVGLIGFIIAVTSQDQLWATPDWRITVPTFAIVAVASVIAIVRRERAFATWLIGLGVAGASLVLGWFVLFAIVVAVTAIVILVLHAVM
jgi:hypothetical protein